MRRKTISALGILAMALATFACCLFLGIFTPTAPASWSQIHPAMTRSEVLAIAGTPQESGWPENITETWERSSVLSNHRLFIVYEGERVRSVCDGTWIRGFGWAHPRVESL